MSYYDGPPRPTYEAFTYRVADNENGVCGECRSRIHPRARTCPRCNYKLMLPEERAEMEARREYRQSDPGPRPDSIFFGVLIALVLTPITWLIGTILICMIVAILRYTLFYWVPDDWMTWLDVALPFLSIVWGIAWVVLSIMAITSYRQHQIEEWEVKNQAHLKRYPNGEP